MSNQANDFSFTDGNLNLSYSTGSFGGPPLFSYQEGKISISTFNFVTEKCSLGTMVSMPIEIVPDGYTREISLIVPHVHLEDNAEQDVETLAIFSKRRSNIAGHKAVKGQVTTYNSLTLHGKARIVAF